MYCRPVCKLEDFHLRQNSQTGSKYGNNILPRFAEPQSFMARAHRVSLIATIITVVYLLLFFNIFPVPLLDPKIAEQILPVV